MRLFYRDKAKRGTDNRKFLKNIFTQKLLQERKLWDKIILENVLGVVLFEWNISMRHKQTDDHKLSYFLLKAILNTILRMENIGQIYHKHKICERLKVSE